jgi:trans-aconitate methyltransferase
MGTEADRYQAIVTYIQKSSVTPPRILDLGCGYGALLEYLPKDAYATYLGVDLSDTAILKARKKKYPNAIFKVSDLHQFKTEEKFDLLVFNEVLYYLDNRSEVVKQLSLFTTPHAKMIVSLYDVKESIVDELAKNYPFLDSTLVYENEGKTKWGINWFDLEVKPTN